MLAAVSILWIYTTVYFSFVNVRVIFVVLASLFLIKETFKNVESVLNFQIKEIFSQLKLDYTLMSGKDEFEIMFKYNKGGKMYAYIVTGEHVKLQKIEKFANVTLELYIHFFDFRFFQHLFYCNSNSLCFKCFLVSHWYFREC